MNAWNVADEPRPEELIAEIYRQYTQMKNAGKQPDRVYLPLSYIRRLRIYHALLGEAANGQSEYLESNAIFGLEFFVHDDKQVIVAAG
jgi:hypothetical protein